MQSYSFLWELIFTKFLRKCMVHARLVDKMGDYLPEEIAGFAFSGGSGKLDIKVCFLSEALPG